MGRIAGCFLERRLDPDDLIDNAADDDAIFCLWCRCQLFCCNDQAFVASLNQLVRLADVDVISVAFDRRIRGRLCDRARRGVVAAASSMRIVTSPPSLSTMVCAMPCRALGVPSGFVGNAGAAGERDAGDAQSLDRAVGVEVDAANGGRSVLSDEIIERDHAVLEATTFDETCRFGLPCC